MKAGSAGSNPDDVANKSADSVSQPLKNFLDEVGGAVSCLNTIVVGLDAVEQGYNKPENLDISWDPSDRKFTARKSRKFVLESILVRVAEAILEYAITLSKLPRMTNVTSKWNGDTSAADKVGDIFEDILPKDFLVPAVVLLMHWRNRVVHRNSKSKLKQVQKKILQANEKEVSSSYKRLSIDCLLCHFEEGRPTLKDVSSLIAMSINAAHEIDKSIQLCLDKADLDALLEHYGIDVRLKRVIAETSPIKLNESIHRVLHSYAPKLHKSYFIHYSQGYVKDSPDSTSS